VIFGRTVQKQLQVVDNISLDASLSNMIHSANLLDSPTN